MALNENMIEHKRAALRDERARLVQIHALNAELRALIVERVAEPKTTLNRVCVEAGVKSGPLNAFFRGKGVLTFGTALTKLAAYLGRPDLAERIAALSKNMQHKKLGMATYQPETIHCIFDALEAHLTYAGYVCSYEEFAAVFGDNKDVIRGALVGKGECIAKLDEDDKLRNDIIAQLHDARFPERMNDFLANLRRERQAVANEYFAHVQQMLENKFANIDTMCAAVGFHPTTHHAIMRADLPADIIAGYARRVREKKQEIMDEERDASTTHQRAWKTDPPPPKTIPTHTSTAKPHNETTPEETASKRLTLRDTGGVRSSLDVEFTLTREGFVELDIKPAEGFVDMVAAHLEIARALLITCAQIQHQETRDTIRQRLQPDVFELSLALDAFSEAHPNMLSEARDARREFAREVLGSKQTKRRSP